MTEFWSFGKLRIPKMGSPINYSTALTSNNIAYTITKEGVTLTNGSVIIFKMPAANCAGEATLNVNGLGAKPMVLAEDQSVRIASGDLKANNMYIAIYNSSLESAGAWLVSGIDAAGGGTSSDIKVKVSSSDSTADYLANKLVAGSNMTITEVDNAGVKTLSLASSGGGSGTDEKSKVSANDTTAGYLNGKLVAGSGISFTEGTDGGNETLSIASTITQYTDEMAQDAVGGILTDSDDIDFTYDDATPSITASLKPAAKIVTDPKNCVLSGYVSSGSPAILSAGTDLQVLIEASSTSLVLAFGAGWDSGGAVQKPAKVTSDGSVSSLTASDTNYIYADRNISTGAVTFVASLYAIDMRMALNSSPADGMHNYIIPENKLYVRESGAWVERQRVPLGEVVTGESSVTSCLTYAFGLDWIGSKLKGFSKEATDAATIEVNCHQCAQNYVTITSTGRTLNHRNLMPGISYNTAIIQGTGGSKTITTYGFYDTAGNALTVKWQGGAVPTLSTDAGAVDILTILVMGGVAYVGSTTGFSTPA